MLEVWEKTMQDAHTAPAVQDQLGPLLERLEEIGKSSTAAVAVQLEHNATAMERLSACLECHYAPGPEGAGPAQGAR